MIFTEIFGSNITELRHEINKWFRKLLKNGIGEENLNLNVLEISSSTTEPTAKAGKVIIYVDNLGNIKAKFPNNTIKTFTTT